MSGKETPMVQMEALISLAAGAALLPGFMRWPMPPAAWAALTLLVHATRMLPPGIGLPSLWLALFLAVAAGQWGIIPIGGAIYFAIVAGISASMVVPFGVDRVASAKLPGTVSTLAFPVALVAIEFMEYRWSPSATWGSIAYTQFGNLPLMQLAAVVGIWGISFLVAWFASTFEYAWSRRFGSSAVCVPLLACLGIISVAVIGGAVRLAAAPTDRAALRVATL